MVVTPSSRPGSRPRRLLWRALLLPLLALGATAAAAQIFKCTADSGNVTYQNEPCPKNVKAGRVDIFDNSWTADRAEKDAQWQRTAAEHQVVAGMPLRWVRAALGEPSEVRETATAGAAQVWLYNLPDRSVQVGILADQVLWSRETPVIPPSARFVPEPDRAVAAAPPPAAEPAQKTVEAPRNAAEAPRGAAEAPRAAAEPPRTAPDAPRLAAEGSRPVPLGPRISESRHGIARGQDCKQALAELGTPDRQRDVPALDGATPPTTEYFYEPAGSDNPTRTRIVCANGKVEGVDHAVIH